MLLTRRRAVNAIEGVVAVLALYFLDYRFCAKYLAEKIFKLDPNASVPSRAVMVAHFEPTD
jgi:carbon starvation protein CstA